LQIRPIQLVGNFVTLDPLEITHVPALFEAANYPAVWAYMPFKVKTLEDMGQLVGEALAVRDQGSELPFVITDRQTGSVIGSTRYLDISSANRSLEIGWTWLSPAVWRTPVNTECKLLLLRHAFETLDVIRVQLKTDARNLRSQRAIERIGGVREGVLRRQRILSDGFVRDSVYYSILAEEWPGVRSRLLERLSRS
jgi:N-acetyltransferase